MNSQSSAPVDINFSVPQGSINGPVYFTWYSSTLGSSVGEDMGLIGYKDDHSIYGNFNAGDTVAEVHTLSQLFFSLDHIKQWMLKNRLKMNDEKIDITIIGSDRSLAKCSLGNIRVGFSDVPHIPCIKQIGICMDEELNFKHQETTPTSHKGNKCQVGKQALLFPYGLLWK